jgi:hypothetical protein
VVGHLQLVADPDGADHQTQRRHERRGLWTSPTLDGMVAIDGLLEPEAGQTLLAALEPLARPATANDSRSGGQRQADALTELARRALEGGRLPQTGGVRPQLTVVVDLASLQRGSWSPASPPATALTIAPASSEHRPRALTTAPTKGWEQDSRPPWPCCPRSWVGLPASLWMSGGPAGSLPPANATPWPCVTAAVSSLAASGPWAGARPTIWCIGWTAAPPTWPTWFSCVGLIIGPSMRAAGSLPAAPTGG